MSTKSGRSSSPTLPFSFYLPTYLAVLGLGCGTQDLLWHMDTGSRSFGLSSCSIGLGCSTTCGMLVPRPGIEPISPAVQGRFLTTGPPGKSPTVSVKPPSSYPDSLPRLHLLVSLPPASWLQPLLLPGRSFNTII